MIMILVSFHLKLANLCCKDSSLCVVAEDTEPVNNVEDTHGPKRQGQGSTVLVNLPTLDLIWAKVWQWRRSKEHDLEDVGGQVVVHKQCPVESMEWTR